MNIEELKHIWQQERDPYLDPGEIEAALKQRSRNALQAVWRSLWWELLALSLLVVGLFIWQWPNRSLWTIWEGGLVLGFLSYCIWFYWRKYQVLKSVSKDYPNLYIALTNQIHALSRYIRLYKMLSRLVLPVFGGLGIVWGFLRGNTLYGTTWSDISLLTWLSLMALMFAYMVFVWKFSQWYMDRLYIRHYDTLNTCLEELKEQPVDTPSDSLPDNN